MSISELIIYGTEQQLRQALERDVNVNLIDEYGYTPLIEALIANDTAKANLLLDHGADVNLRDITERSPLHWATENSNVDIVRRLLEKGANANAYNFAGEPALVKPLLRQQRELIQLLWEHGANSDFAHDFISAKSLGHQFELVGSVDIATPEKVFTEIDYEGFYFEFSLEFIAYTVREYINNYAARDVRSWLPVLQNIANALRNATRLIKYDHYLMEAEQHKKEIEGYIEHQPLIIPMSQEGHAVTMVRHKNLFAICDRANIQNDEGITIYYINKPYQLNYERIFDWIYNKQELKLLYRSLPVELGLQKVASVPLSKQLIGNCSWANSEAVVPVLYYMLQTNNSDNTLKPDAVLTDAMDIYYRWHEWSKERSLQQCIQSFVNASPARKASKAASLAAILFQTCSADNPEHFERAKRIIPVLQTPGYEYILESYIRYYSHMKPTAAGKNLQRILDAYEREVF